MSGASSIEWTDATWNPVRGCIKVSPDCKHCYAETFAERFRGVTGHPYERGFDPRLVPESLSAPLHWKAPRTVFVNSMSDLFADFVPDEYIAAVFGVMAATPRHTYQILTKRADRLPAWTAWAESRSAGAVEKCLGEMQHRVADEDGNIWLPSIEIPPWPLPNAWLGVSVEDRKYGLPRIDELREIPAALRFLSIEPLLEDLGPINLTGIGWVIVGGRWRGAGL